MIGRLLLVGLFFIGMINGRPQQDHLDKAIWSLLELEDDIYKSELKIA